MEIRQVLKSSASMIPDLFYKVSDETRETEEDREEKDGGREGGAKREETTVHGGRRRRAWKNPHRWKRWTEERRREDRRTNRDSS